ncbi:MAG: ATP-binding protein, partial [Cyanobacteriota bacterium]|nr:ATP-binding protein [Cyanobacteriota bacterium]
IALRGVRSSWLILARDITERKQAEAQLKQTNEELARATRLKDEFLANMSHELRTPLNAILGMTEVLQEEVLGDLNSQQRKALETVERSGCHLLELINDILDVAKIESGQIELDCTSVSIHHLCQSSLSFIKQQALKKRIQLEIKLPVNLPEVVVDERRIRQVLINLLNNAVKFTPEGGRITLEVTFPVQNTQESTVKNPLQIDVIDTGIGIPSEKITKLFQPFVQIDSALNRQYTGTGLGLALVKRIVELHGGEVKLTSQEGVGSCFSILLPSIASFSSSAELQTSSRLNTRIYSAQPQDSPLILLAEDNEANIRTISSYLRAKRYRLVVARNGEEAIIQAQLETPDLIVMDIQMPKMDGLEAIKRIRQDPNLVHIPIVALTALAMSGDREQCLEAGASDYLSKPIQLKQLVNSIQRLLTLKSS